MVAWRGKMPFGAHASTRRPAGEPALAIALLALALVACCTRGAAAAGAARDYPTFREWRLAGEVVPGYARLRVAWSGSRLDSLVREYKKPARVVTLCSVAGGSAAVDAPLSPGRRVLMFLGHQRTCGQLGRGEIWSAYRVRADGSEQYVGSRWYAPGQPLTVDLYPADDERVVLRRTNPPTRRCCE